MKIVIYSVVEKRPPVGEQVMRWDIADDGDVGEVSFDTAEISLPANEEERAEIPPEVVPDMGWRRSEMCWSDRWSFATTSKGD